MCRSWETLCRLDWRRSLGRKHHHPQIRLPRFSNWSLYSPELRFRLCPFVSLFIDFHDHQLIYSDLTLYTALRTLQQSHPDLTITKSQSFFEMSGTISGGTISTMHTMREIPRSERRTDEWQMVSTYRKLDSVLNSWKS